MRIKYKLASLLLLAALSSANAQSYYIQYKGIKLGEIENLNTLKELYLNAKVTNFIAKLLLNKDRFVFYGGEKPRIAHAKYRKDKNQILFALYEAITNRPVHKEYIIKTKKLILECHEKECHYTFYKKHEVKGKGLILFDKNNQFYKLTEDLTGVVIGTK